MKLPSSFETRPSAAPQDEGRFIPSSGAHIGPRVVGLAFLLLAGAAQGGSLDAHSPLGRYALDAASCKAKDYFATLDEKRLTLPTYGCQGVDYDETENKGGRALFAVTARACSGEEDAKPHRDAFQMTLENGALQFLWKDGTKSAKLVRCSAGAGAR